ncbi:MAG TPA: ATP-binding cassette domain-containing protein, partial [Methylomirabilota bacterium]|nr:ATP-binding cassette domain-containing protein [Methylomirabilota bacterium]
MAYIEIRDLTKIFSADGVETPALRGVTLDIKDGEFAAVVGPSGSGKSTLFHCMGGLLRPTSGTISIAGEEITAIPPSGLAEFRLRSVGFVFQAYNLITVLTALENVEYV